MNKTKIEWCDYSANPVSGYCPMACKYCYARVIYDRFHWDKAIRFHLWQMYPMPKKPSLIFVGSTMELFGPWVKDEWMQEILDCVAVNPEHIFIFLTKKPENLAKWNPWPDNAWVGTTIDGTKPVKYMRDILWNVDAKTRFISFEPLLGLPHVKYGFAYINWLIIGAQTGAHAKQPDPLWVKEIIAAADYAGVPVFVKDNLNWPEKRQEFPNGKQTAQD